VIGLQLLPTRPIASFQARVGRMNPAVLGAALAVLILFVAATVPSGGVPPFIYFRF
jgi:alginate O-acetyltransferase complex protein AlgI